MLLCTKQCPCFLLAAFIRGWMAELLICPLSTYLTLTNKLCYFYDCGAKVCRLYVDQYMQIKRLNLQLKLNNINPPNPARPYASTNKMPIALVSTHNQRSDLVCFLITHPLNSRPTASCLNRGCSCRSLVIEDTCFLRFGVTLSLSGKFHSSSASCL